MCLCVCLCVDLDLVCMHARTHTCSRRADGYCTATATKCGRAKLERCPALHHGDGGRDEDGGAYRHAFFCVRELCTTSKHK
jgi:hypothetical protein